MTAVQLSCDLQRRSENREKLEKVQKGIADGVGYINGACPC